MPFALLIIGLVLIVAAVRDTGSDLVTLVKGDFSGPANFVYWVAALLMIGAIGYIPKAKPISDAFLVLVILVLVLSRGNPKNPGGGFFQQIVTALGVTKSGGSTATASTGMPTLGPLTPVTGSGGSGITITG